MTKSIRERNVIHYDVRVSNCRLADNPITAFWILGEREGQIQQLTPSEIPKFRPIIVRENSQQLEFTLGVFREIEDPIVDNPILVKLVDCVPKAFIRINGTEIELNEIWAKISILRMGVRYLLIKGKAPNGTRVTHRIEA
jgi:hypothetical protein